MTLFGALWIEVAGQSATSSDPIVWAVDFPASYAEAIGAVGAGFSSAPIPGVREATDRCFLSGWRWERAGSHRVLSEQQAHALWRQETLALGHELGAIERSLPSVSRTLSVPEEYASQLRALGYDVVPVSMPDAAALDAADAALAASGAPAHVLAAGRAINASLRRLLTEPPQAAPVPPALSLAERIERQRARADLTPEQRRQLEAMQVPPEPAGFGPDYGRPVMRRESDDLLVRGRTWGELETDFREALAALKEALQ